MCLDPQERVLIPFDYNINNRLVVKDNHRPCIPKPIDVNQSLPPDTGDITCDKISEVCGVPTGAPGVRGKHQVMKIGLIFLFNFIFKNLLNNLN